MLLCLRAFQNFCPSWSMKWPQRPLNPMSKIRRYATRSFVLRTRSRSLPCSRKHFSRWVWPGRFRFESCSADKNPRKCSIWNCYNLQSPTKFRRKFLSFPTIHHSSSIFESQSEEKSRFQSQKETRKFSFPYSTQFPSSWLLRSLRWECENLVRVDRPVAWFHWTLQGSLLKRHWRDAPKKCSTYVITLSTSLEPTLELFPVDSPCYVLSNIIYQFDFTVRSKWSGNEEKLFSVCGPVSKLDYLLVLCLRK